MMPSLIRFTICLAICLFCLCRVWAQATAFTYQAKLNDGANPASGNYDIQFKLFDTPTVGTGVQQGSTITNASVAITGGIFSVQLDFGLPAYSGPPRYLELGVRPAGSPNAYTILGPRSPVSSTPYSVRSLNSSVADTLSSACVGCVTEAQIGSLPANSGNYIQNSTSVQGSSNFNITGTGAATFFDAFEYKIGGARILSSGGSGNTIAGLGSGPSNLGSDNSIFGRNAAFSNFSGSFNSFFGTNASTQNTSGDNNSFFGYFVAPSNTTGSYNSFFGRLTGQGNISGSHNTLIGDHSNVELSNLTYATAIGSDSVVSNSNSVVLGRGLDTVRIPGKLNLTGRLDVGGVIDVAEQINLSGNRVLATPIASNTFVGPGTGTNYASGGFNTYVGTSAGFNTTTGTSNSFFGMGSGLANTTGTFNTLVGRNADVTSGNLTHATAIGAESIATQSNSIYLGRPGGEDAVRIPGAVAIDGTLVVGTLGSAGSTSVCLNAANRVSPCSSSLRYKTSVHSFSRGLDIVRRLRPITFDWKDGGARDVGFGAEEVNEVEPLLTTRNDKGEIEGVKYAQITTVLVNAVKEQQAVIESQQRTNESQTRQIAEQRELLRLQQQQLDALKKEVRRRRR